MSEERTLLSQIYVLIDGADVPDELMDSILEVRVESSLHLADVAALVIHDPSMRWCDDALLAPGKTLQVSAKNGGGDQKIFDGEIVELEPEFVPATMRLTVRAFSRMHRLTRGRHARTFQNATDSDIIEKLASEVGLQAQVATTSYVHPYMIQDNETNLEFLSRRAKALGYLLFVRDQTLHCEPPQMNGSAVDLEWGVTLSEFRPRLTTMGQADSVIVRGWDPENRQEIIGLAERGNGKPDVGEAADGGEFTRQAFNLPTQRLVTDGAVRTQAEADQLAQALANQISSSFIQAEGICGGNPAVLAGATAQLSAVGDRFSGSYLITSATHTYDQARGYITEFSISGHEANTLVNAIDPDLRVRPHRQPGLAVAVVTDNLDPEGLGRVKVKFPWLASDVASFWVRVVIVGGGHERGIQFLPEIDDEVLVGFESGDMNYPYVLGGLWNGVDKPPKPSNEVLEGSRVQQRIIRSRDGNMIILDDSDADGGITIEDKNGNSFKLSTRGNTLDVKAQGNVTLSSQGDLTLEAQGRVQIKSGAGVQVDGGGGFVEVTAPLIKLN
jgi:phage protein D/phage baseplate assembly protein gpV